MEKNPTARSLAHKLLASSKETDHLEGLKQIRSKGDASSIPVMLELTISAHASPKVKLEIFGMLKEIKVRGAEQPLIDALLDNRFETIRAELLSAIWCSGLNPVKGVHVISQIAVSGSLVIAIECMTVIDNLEPPFDDTSLSEAQIILGNYLNNNPHPELEPIIRSMFNTVNQMAELS